MSTPRNKITFSFGENWQEYLKFVTNERIEAAMRDILEFLGVDAVRGTSIIDIGSGSGIHSYCFHRLGAARVVSLDLDPFSVAATRSMWERAGGPEHWTVLSGSVLDEEFLRGLGTFDIVYSWGVLHHTGRMWTAIGNACSLVAAGGKLWIAIYAKGPGYDKDLKMKQRYNSASALRKWLMVREAIARKMLWRIRKRQNPFAWNRSGYRGMDAYHDIIDWIGGLPYEVASEDEIVTFCRTRGFVLDRIVVRGERYNNIYVFSSQR